MIRYATMILAVILLLSMLVAFSILIKNLLDQRLQMRKEKSKVGNLPSDAGVRELVAQGKIEEAIELYRRFTGLDEFAARRAVEDISREIRLSDFDNHMRDILSHDGKAAAIEAYQTNTGSELEEALRYVETIEKDTH